MTALPAVLIDDYSKHIDEQINWCCPERLRFFDPTALHEKNDPTYRSISTLLDSSFHKAYVTLTNRIRYGLSIQAGIHTLGKKTLCGGFKEGNNVLAGRTAFEQMFAVSEYIEANPIATTTNTYSFETGNKDWRVLPVQMFCSKSNEIKYRSLWRTVLGAANSNIFEASPYKTFAKEDPRLDKNCIFIDPLTCLEMHRNPARIGALAMKSAAYESGYIDHLWRFKSYHGIEDELIYRTASAELTDQATLKTKSCVGQASGFNLCEFISRDWYRRKPNKRNFLPEGDYARYPEGSASYERREVSAVEIVRTFPEALRGKTESLDALTARVFASRLGKSEIPAVKEYITKNLLIKESEAADCR